MPPVIEPVDAPASSSQAAPPPWGAGPLVWIAAATLVGAAVCWLAARHGYAPDELANVSHSGPWDLFVDPESGVNPPLLRLVVNAGFDTAGSLIWGRALTLACGIAAIPVMAALTRRVAGTTSAITAAWVLALHLDAVRMSAQIRAYSPFLLVTLLHLLAVARWRERPSRTTAVWVTALLLPQLHYFGAPLLLGIAAAAAADPSTRRLWRAYVPAALALLPLVPMMLGGEEARVEMRRPLIEVLAVLGSLGLQAPAVLGQVASAATGLRPDLGLHTAQAVLTAAVAAAAWWFGPRSPLRGLLFGATAGLLGGVLLFSLVQYVRSPVSVMFTAAMLPWIVGLLGAAGPALATALFAAPLGFGLIDIARPWPEDALMAFDRHLPAWETARAGRPIFVAPEHALGGLHVALTGRQLADSAARGAGVCDGDPRCFVYGTIPFRGLVEPSPVDGLLVLVEAAVPTGCVPLAAAKFLAVVDCRLAP